MQTITSTRTSKKILKLTCKTVLLSLILIFLILPSIFAVEHIKIEISVDTAYLPYKSVEARESIISNDCSYPENNPIEVIKPAIQDKSEGLLLLSNNPPPNSGGYSIFNPRTFPDFEVPDDDGIRYVITNWTHYSISNDSTIIAGVCHNDDSIFAFKLFMDSDSVEYKPIYSKDSTWKGPIVPNIQVLYIGDYDKDQKNDILLNLDCRGHFRKLIQLDFETLQIKWELKVSSSFNKNNFNIFEDSQEPKLIFTTGNPANGMVDSIYNDYYSYLTILDNDGNILFNEKASLYGRRTPFNIKSEIEDVLFITHYLDFDTHDSTAGKNRNEYFLSKINSNGEILKSIVIRETPIDLNLLRHGPDNKLKLFVRFGSKAISIYDYDLNFINDIEPLEYSMIYNGRYMIAGESDSVYVLYDGIYDKNFNKLMQFPFKSGSFAPVEYDTLGNVTAYLITGNLHYYIGYIIKKTSVELASVFYHRNKLYVLIFLSSLLVGLVTTNIFRSRSKSNLNIISKQKFELEKTHQSLKEAQATIVAQEKFQQAKDIAGGFAHEIRNSLFPARSALSKLNQATDDKLTDKTWVIKLSRFTDESVSRAIKLTESISKYTILESSKKDETVNLNKLIDEIIQSNSLRISEQNVQVEINIEKDTLVSGNNEQFFLVFNNLLINALDALTSTDNRKIEIISTTENKSVTIKVIDNGHGISQENLDKIFDFFYSTKPSSGIGIGLAMVKKIIELYDSKITVDSKVNQGTVFTLRLNRTNNEKAAG